MYYLWWFGFTAFAFFCSYLMPGVCFFAAGFVLALEKEENIQPFILALIWSFLIDGVNAGPFGFSFLWFFLIFLMVQFLKSIFYRSHSLYMLLLGAILGVTYILFVHAFYAFAKVEVSSSRIFFQGFFLMIFFPIEYFVLFNNYSERRVKNVSHR